MKFLCLHGSGTNSSIMQSRTGALRHELGEGYQYEFVEATLPAPMAKGVEALSSLGHGSYAFFDPDDLPNTLQNALDQLDSYIAFEGPFDAVMGFSAGAVLAAAYMLQKGRKSQKVPFRCAIFLSSAECAEELRYPGLDHTDRNNLIRVPTAHIWGLHDDTAPLGGKDLSCICDPTNRLVLVHDGGHELPRIGHLTEAAHIIRRAIRLSRLAGCTD
ncbi:serine hydrolase FSH [Biscogniauxia mediterranea]|nr:serine hydrolase FSH [Biscogniauxia mediterranea]